MKKEIVTFFDRNRYICIIGIENGIVQIGGKWIDLAVIVLEDQHGELFLSTSTGVEFGEKYVNIAKERGFDKVTVGSIIAKELGIFEIFAFSIFTVSRSLLIKHAGCDPLDPHAFLTKEHLPRKDTLTLGVRSVIAQKLYKGLE